MSVVELIQDWRNKFGLPIRTEISIPDKQETHLALELIEEEARELEEAVINIISIAEIAKATSNEWIKDNISVNEVADALADILFVTVGMANVFGLNVEEIVKKVYDSNMSKLCKTLEEAEETIELYKQREIEAYYEQLATSEYVIKRTSDNKVLKGCNFHKPLWEYDYKLGLEEN